MNQAPLNTLSPEHLHLTAPAMQLAMEVAGIATWEIDLRLDSILYSSNLPKVYGCDSRKIYTRNELKAMVNPLDRENIVNPAMSEGLKSGTYSFETRMHPAKGEEIWIHVNGRVLYDNSGKPEKILGTAQNVTAAKKSFDNSAQLAAIVNSSYDAIISNQLDGTILTWNKSAERIFGYRSEEIIGRSVLTLFPKNRYGEEEAIMRRINNGELIAHFETQRVTKNGDIIDVSLSLSPLYNEEGKIGAVSKIARDITIQKKAERLITQSEARLQLVMEASGIGMWELNLQTQDVSYSRTYLSMIGYAEGTHLTPEMLLRHVHPDDLAMRNMAFEKAMQSGRLDYHFRLIRVDGEERWVEVKGTAILDEFNRPLKILGTIRDITDEKLGNELLQESEHKFRILADSLPQFIWTSDGEGNLDYFNRSIFEYSGYNEEDLKNEGWLKIVHPDDREENIRRWAESMRTGEPFIFEHRFRRHDGVYHWQLSRAMPQRDDEGVIQRWVGTSTDVHHQKTFAEELERSVSQRTAELSHAVAALTKMNEELEQFAYVSSHDLQEPLRKIQTFVGLLTLQLKAGDEKATTFLKKIDAAAKRMSELITDLLQYSRLKTTDDKFVSVDLNEIVSRVIDDYEITIASKDAQINLECRLPEVQAVPLQMNQLFFNLIGNSLKFSDKKPEINITCGTVKGGEDNAPGRLRTGAVYHLIRISDNGIGFSNQYAERIFTIFQRLNTRELFEGTGIGLAICKKIVENHKGVIEAKGEEGKGSVFSIYLPA
jgi:PAS domain S-box-containing protein